jgi:acid phosphatase type 7
LSKFQQSYDPTWGQLKSITRPVVGNHEYLTSGASGYYDYFGTAAGDRTEGYSAFDLGNNWIAIAANTMCSQVGGCAAGSPQYNFVKSVLEANAGKHFIVYMHHPFWSTGKYHNCCDSNLTDLYKLFYQHGVELSLAGHDHNYQRHAPQTPSGRLDPNGIRHFVVGTGGKNVQDVDANKSANNWEFASETHHGILKLLLYSDHYEWAFINDSGIVIDSGSHTVQ